MTKKRTHDPAPAAAPEPAEPRPNMRPAEIEAERVRAREEEIAATPPRPPRTKRSRAQLEDDQAEAVAGIVAASAAAYEAQQAYEAEQAAALAAAEETAILPAEDVDDQAAGDEEADDLVDLLQDDEPAGASLLVPGVETWHCRGCLAAVPTPADPKDVVKCTACGREGQAMPAGKIRRGDYGD